MKTFIIALIASLIPMLSFGKNIKVAEKNYVDTIKIIVSNDMIYVPVTIKGKTYQFLYDTGASACVIPDGADELFEKETRKQKVRSADGVVSKNNRSGILSEMTIGNLHFKGMEGIMMKDQGADSLILGARLLYRKGILAKLDMKEKILILTDRKNFFDGEKGYHVPTCLFYPDPTVNFSLSNGCKGRVLFDSGFNGIFAFERKYYDESCKGADSLAFKKQIQWTDFGSTMVTANGAEAACDKIIMKLDLKLKNITFCDVNAMVHPKYTGMGAEILKYTRLIINPKNFELIFQPYCDSDSVRLRFYDSGIGYNSSDGKMKVEVINTNGEVYKKGVRKGDYLIEIAGQPAETYEDYVKVLDEIDKYKPFIVKYRKTSGEIIEAEFPALEEEQEN